MPVWMSATLFLAAPGQAAPIASVQQEPIFVGAYRDCLLAVAVHRARTTILPADTILTGAFAACADIRRAAQEGGVAGEEPEISQAWLARLDMRERRRLCTLIDANRGNGGG